MIEIAFTGLLLLIGVFFGTRAQKKHVADLKRREAELSHIIVTNLKTLPDGRETPMLLTGSVVIAFDYFRRFIGKIIIFFGGRISLYEDMMDRARREALVRLLEKAEAANAREVHNVRFESYPIGGGAELLAYGTAVL